MTELIFTLTGLSMIAATVGYLVVYTARYDWFKSRLGRVMNLSLIAVATFAFGVIVAEVVSHLLGAALAAVGGSGYVAAIWLRLRVLRALREVTSSSRK